LGEPASEYDELLPKNFLETRVHGRGRRPRQAAPTRGTTRVLH
jgi:hypothetical protein